MTVTIQTIGTEQFSLYDAIPINFEVTSVLRVEVVDGGFGGFRLVEEALDTPYLKDYNISDEDGPTAWARDFDVSQWVISVAFEGERPLGGVTVVPDFGLCPSGPCPRQDLAVVWDIRVHPDARGQGIGAQLVHCAAGWARQKGFGQLVFETQNVNVPACRFYARQGCTLGAIHRFGYAGCSDIAHEAVLLWYLDL